ncbi:MAG: DUF1801 domain-containing protein [Bacteroidota bacterium]
MDEYIAGFPSETRAVLQQIRQTIIKAAPAEAVETISYGIPTFKWNGTYLVYFAGYKNHVSIHPAPVEAEEFKADFSRYKTGKGTVQFPLNQPIPFDLITRIVKHLIVENLKRAKKR